MKSLVPRAVLGVVLLLVTLTSTPALAQGGGGGGGSISTATLVNGVPGLSGDLRIQIGTFPGTFLPYLASRRSVFSAGPVPLQVQIFDNVSQTPLSTIITLFQPGVDYSVVAHLGAGGSPAISVVADDTTPVPAGLGLVVLRHFAAAGTVDFEISRLGAALARVPVAGNGLESSTLIASDTKTRTSVDLFAAGGSTPLATAFSTPVRSGRTYFVHAFGDAGGSGFALAGFDVDRSGPRIAFVGAPCAEGRLSATIGVDRATSSPVLQLRLSSLPANSSPFILFGGNRIDVGLGPIGAPSCVLQSTTIAPVPLSQTGSTASIDLILTPSLIAILPPTYWQGGHMTTANVLGVGLTRTAELTV